MEQEIFLDLNQVNLFGWESIKKYDKVARMVEDIKRGNHFPAVPIKKTSTGYSLIYISSNGLEEDGGHYRAVAHYINSNLLRCKLVDKGLPVPKDNSVNIRDITLTF